MASHLVPYRIEGQGEGVTTMQSGTHFRTVIGGGGEEEGGVMGGVGVGDPDEKGVLVLRKKEWDVLFFKVFFILLLYFCLIYVFIFFFFVHNFSTETPSSCLLPQKF